MPENMIGRVFNNRYKIIERIGIGGMAEVYRAQDNTLGRSVAVKIMLPQYASDPQFAQRFRQEAASAANLQSPYIVNIYDWGQDEGTFYIVMEFVRGSDLKTGIKERGRINQRKVAEIGSQVCQALHVAHNMDIIHRDIKPQNIMVQPDGNVKVMDFGIARAKNSVDTQTSTVLGTAHYISPEQAQGKELGPTSDIYSLGIVMYEAATGKLPFDGPDAVNVAMQQVNNMPLLPSAVYPEIDPDLEAIIWKAIQKNPRDRFATASEMRKALNCYLSGRPVDISFAGSNRTANVGATQIMPKAQPAEQQSEYKPVTYRSDDDDKSKKKSSTGKTVGIVVGVIAALAVVALAVWFFCFRGTGTDTVPDVTGMTVAEATSTLESAGFKVGTTSQNYSSDYEANYVMAQDPTAGSKQNKGVSINLVISKGTEQVQVPDLTGMTAQEAQAALSKVGLTASAGTAEYSSDVDAGKIMSQKPAAKETVAKGSSVEYILSLGTESISVPDVTGYTKDTAVKTLESAGFKVSETEEYSKDVAEGKVISQNPATGKLEKGDTVSIVVSKGEDPSTREVEVPNVVGMTVANATTTLESAGFGVYVAGDTAATASVTAQSVTGTAVVGTTITITGKASTPSNNTSTKTS